MWYRLADRPSNLVRNLYPVKFWVDKREIKPGEEMGKVAWHKLLKTTLINVRNENNLLNFLNSRIVKDNRGKNVFQFFIPATLLNNPIEGGFWVGDIPIEESHKDSIRGWIELLGVHNAKFNSQETLNSYLLSTVKKYNGKNIYEKSKSHFKSFQNNYDDFFVGRYKVEKGKSYSENKWKKFLTTDRYRIDSQEKLDFFLLNANFNIDENGNKFYIPSFGSFREKFFKSKLNISNDHDIQLVPQKKIQILNPGKSYRILRLDFAFVRDEKILLAIEINGGQHYGFVAFGSSNTYEDWQAGLKRDIEKINYCHNNNIPLLIFNHLLPEKYFMTIIDNLNKNPHMYDGYIPQPVIDNNVANTSLEFIKRQIYSHLYPVFNGTISFSDDISKKRYIKDTLILISKLMGIYEGGIDKTDYINSFDAHVDLTDNYNKCLAIYNSLYPDYPLDYDKKITYNDLSKKIQLSKPKQETLNPLEK